MLEPTCFGVMHGTLSAYGEIDKSALGLATRLACPMCCNCSTESIDLIAPMLWPCLYMLLQRDRFKCDWHRYNVRRRVAKQPPVSEAQFEALLENDSEVGT